MYLSLSNLEDHDGPPDPPLNISIVTYETYNYLITIPSEEALNNFDPFKIPSVTSYHHYESTSYKACMLSMNGRYLTRYDCEEDIDQPIYTLIWQALEEGENYSFEVSIS